MANVFSEVVITAPFMMTKGFLMGFMKGRNKDFPYFFHRKHGINHEGVGDLMREFLHSTCHTHVCLPEDLLAELESALSSVEEKLAARIESKKRINSAALTFSFHIYDEAHTGACKELFRSLPAGAELHNFVPIELRGDTIVGVAEFSKIYQYCYEGNGKVTGDFEGVMYFFLKVKRYSLSSSILCSDIKLILE
jgi:hypothetical protein